MKAAIPAAGVLAALAVFSAPAVAASYAWFDRPDDASANSHAAVSNDVYVRGFGWAWGELHMQQDTSPGAAAPAAPQGRRQARDYPDRRDAPPWLQRDDNGPPRTPRGKISMNLAAAPADGTIGGGTAGQPRVVVR
ncbi:MULTISPECIES: hypothetical protein [Cupriavidus]|uniref:Uncharacterized protein n=1 Tax=Cupriavidus oxalaticus TaxID=96344 RepID=A0A4V1BY64_9BURK|nr:MULTISPECIES: hypothetical protein [Cupriavidus]MBF6990482.1 hypothetical protein [Cupriavidus sp. IK-TO18]QBY50732.1 hypothetical protein E0W60_06020 [Cupriavidus oxalaticus]